MPHPLSAPSARPPQDALPHAGLGALGWRDPLALSAGAGARLLLAGGVLALLWAAVIWAMQD